MDGVRKPLTVSTAPLPRNEPGKPGRHRHRRDRAATTTESSVSGAPPDHPRRVQSLSCADEAAPDSSPPASPALSGPHNARLLAALGLSPAFAAGGGSDVGLSFASSAAPYAPSADSPAAAHGFGSARFRQPSSLSIGVAANPATDHMTRSAGGGGAGAGLSSPQWGWYVSLSPPLGPPGSRAIGHDGAAGAGGGGGGPVGGVRSPARSVLAAASDGPSSPAVRQADGLDMYVSGMGLPVP